MSLKHHSTPSPASDTDGLRDDPGLDMVARRYAVAVTPDVRAAMHSADPHTDPVARQYLPQIEELLIRPEEDADPIGDEAHSPVEGIVHRYPDRVLLKIVNSCAVYCRYCFRREMVGPGKAQGFGPEKLEAALDYIEKTPRIWEVILTGGDPLVLSPRRLETVIDRLNAIEHVQIIRIHTRVPVADPGRITADLCAALTSEKALYVSLHVNHAQELTEDVRSAIARLRRADCVLLSQSVLLRGVNDSVDALEDLFRQLTALRVKPYYLHHPDLARGTGHFRLPVSEGQNLMRGLKARASGLCQPHYMLDIPGGHGKVPIGPSYIENEDNAHCTLRDHHGRRHAYPPSPVRPQSDKTD